MFGDCGIALPCFGRHRRPRDGSNDVDREPVLLVSGIGGSILNSKQKNNGSLLRIWVRILFSNYEFKKHLWSIYNPETGYTETLNPDIDIVVPDDDYGLYAIDILDPAWWVKLLHVTDVYHFHDMIDMLIDCGYKKGTTLFGYGYDFRQSNRIDKVMNGLQMKLQTAYKASGGKKVNVISHSMGGLLVQCFMYLHKDVFAKYVNKWITIATPFQGAPGCIYDSLLTGLQFVYGFKSFFFVSRWTMHQLLVECPSIYEMLPNPGFKWKEQPVIQVWRKYTEGDESVKLEVYKSVECFDLFRGALRDNELTYNGKSVALPFNLSILKWAVGTRQMLDNALLPDSVDFYNIYGISYDTPHNVCYGSEASPIDDLPEICHTMPEYSYVDGDGTVPSESAEADGFNAKARVAVKGEHRELLRSETVLKLIKNWLGLTQQSQTSVKAKVANVFPDLIPSEEAYKNSTIGLREDLLSKQI
ncbi:hypothetical protein M5K25_001567 [Dendrobium thyrsiflorum]|uniref:Uncharacterized protein n=1 Tax=Dendrobium thyrsiflorum TaxID=117978 RepID=A0ABD0VYJ1_DENTH